jgi:hypothetical protein
MIALGEGITMKNKLIAAVGAASLSLCISASASHAASLEPGETMGLAALSPLPEGVFALDDESYGGANSAQHVGVNIPILVWSTPWVLANTRVEFIVATPFAHLDGNAPTSINHVGLITALYGAIFAHDFGGGLTGGLLTGLRTPDPDPFLANQVTGRTTIQGDFRGGLYYTKDNWNLYETSWVTTSFGGNDANNDSIGIDFSVSHTFDKLELGFVGYSYADISNGRLSGGRNAQTELGGLIGYAFGPFSLQAQVTHAVSTTLNGIEQPKETRGWLRLIVPLWVAPTQTAAAPLKARY